MILVIDDSERREYYLSKETAQKRFGLKTPSLQPVRFSRSSQCSYLFASINENIYDKSRAGSTQRIPLERKIKALN